MIVLEVASENLDDFEFNLTEDIEKIEAGSKNCGYYVSLPVIKIQLLIEKHQKMFNLAVIALFSAGYIIFTGFSLKRNFSEGLIPLVLGILAGFRFFKNIPQCFVA